MELRNAKTEDLAAIAALERACYPAEEAASEAQFRDRLQCYANHFYLLWDGDRLVSVVDGMTTDEKDLADEMYEHAAMHRESGAWQMLFGVLTHPDYRGRGCAGKLLTHAIETARREGRKGLVLTCKEELIGFYAPFGFADEGTSASAHGGVVWHQMRLTF